MDEALDLSGFATRDAVDSCAMQAWYVDSTNITLVYTVTP